MAEYLGYSKAAIYGWERFEQGIPGKNSRAVPQSVRRIVRILTLLRMLAPVLHDQVACADIVARPPRAKGRPKGARNLINRGDV
jgi:hypothetical protein